MNRGACRRAGALQAVALELLVFLLAGVALQAQAVGGDAMAAISAQQRIRVVCDDNYPPYAFLGPEGKLQGIVPDQWQAWEKQTGVHVDIQGLPWDEALAAFNAGRADVLDTVFETAERRLIYDFTPAYATLKVPIFIHKSLSGIAGIEDLKGFKVAVKEGDAAIGELSSRGVTDLSRYPSYEAIIEDAARLDLRVFCIDEPPAYYFLYKHKVDRDFRIAFILNEGAFHRAVRKGNRVVLQLVEHGFATIPPSTYEAIDRKWLGSKLARDINFRILGMVGIGLAGLFAFLVGLIWTFRRQVKRATSSLAEKVLLLEASEARNKAFIEALPDLFFVFDREGRFLEFLTSTPNLLAMEPERFVGRRPAEIGFPEELAEEFSEKLAETMEKRGMSTIEYQLDMPSGRRLFEGRMVPLGEDRALLVARDITDVREKDRQLLASLEEKSVLLKEIHHRVKNNMQIISSLIQLQTYEFRDKEDLALMRETQARIYAMAQLHDLLYGSPDLASIDTSEYLLNIAMELKHSFGAAGLSFRGLPEPVPLNIDVALPLGLAMNELVLNAIKYAYPEGRQGPIEVDVRREASRLVLRVRDEGRGLPPGISPMTSATMGFTIVRSLAVQLNGSISYLDGMGEPGFCAELSFPVASLQPPVSG